LKDLALVSLVAAIFRLTAQDIRFGKVEIKQEALEFLETELFIDMCDAFHFDPKETKRLILESPIVWRKTYES